MLTNAWAVPSHRAMSVLKLVSFLLVITLLAMLAPLSPARVRAAKAQPHLLALAAQQPESRINVIVQKQTADKQLESLVASLGGQVTQELAMINSFAAELPASVVTSLAREAGVRWVSLDAPVVKSGRSDAIDTSNLANTYVRAIGADRLWNDRRLSYLQGQGVGVAIVDSGIADHNDTNTRVVAQTKFNSFSNSLTDQYGHGSHVAGIIGGNGARSRGAYIGVAPKVNLISVKVSDDVGGGTIADVVNGLEWIYQNKHLYNIRVVNLSLNSSVPESYHTSPLSAAVEILWFNGVVVVVSAGNNGTSDSGILYPPANDPFVITVGASNDQGTADVRDDALASFSAYGTTSDGFSKPEIVAPGTNIISLLASNGAALAKGHPEHRVNGGMAGKDYYFRMSGTSMAAAVTSGAVALLLQDEPNLTPDQVKHRLVTTAAPFSAGNGAGLLDINAAVHGRTTANANTGVEASQLLWSGSEPVTWNSVAWNSVAWNSVAWNSVAWNSVAWNSVAWNSVAWNSVAWNVEP